ncbi:outer membrane beta-barrel protein [Agaribacter marinus]|uniref:Outer membrane protein beta-barrel domain-containing protein n=1 Tax=Agaribacter marinus TaxID=1431249 RepID=A0AA37SXN8_9ALTE|nr:outer membrane beta-barrel protein [Agaribacter marinus]GLR71736.1 hypothetical protein GCM10007852_26440 [Agaribacter marinus]
MILKRTNIKAKQIAFCLRKIKFNRTKIAVLLTSSLSLTCQANDLSSGFYGGFGIANISAEEKGASSKETGLTLIGGYKYSKYLSYEASLFNLGDHKTLGMKGKGLSISTIGSYPITETIDLFAEFGGVSINLDINEAQNLANTSHNQESLKDGRDSSIYYALGAKYKIKNWSFVIKTVSIDLDADITMLSTQVHYHF